MEIATVRRSELVRATPADVFRARCEARALLYVVRQLDLHEAVDALQRDAIASGLVRQIGQDAAQAIMAAAFSEVRRDV
jgi:hypothetical protein